jgi:DNA-directed RNA polymerase specialized sigma24 family protein
MSRLPIDIMEHDWQRELNSPLLRERFRKWRETAPALARFEDPPAVLRFLRGPGSNACKDAVLSSLLERARTEPLAGRLVLEAMLPGLKKLAGRILTDAREREELWSALMACAWEQIRNYPVERRPRKVAANLLLDCLRGTLRSLAGARGECTALPWLALGELESPERCEGDVDGLLTQATAAGAVSEVEAELILSTRIDGLPLRVLARSQGVKFDTLKHRRNRAERRLLVFLGLRPVPRGDLKRPFPAARVAGDGPAGLAGGDDESNQ